MAEFLTKTGRKKCKYTQNILLYGCLPFKKYLQEKNICLYPETVPRNKTKFLEESLRGDKLVKNLEKFCMNNKTIIEFGFTVT